MLKTRVKFMISGTNEIRIGYLKKDKLYKNGFKVVSDKTSYGIQLLSLLEKI